MKLVSVEISDRDFLISLEELSNDDSSKWNKIYGILDVFPHYLTEEEIDKTPLGGKNTLIEHNLVNEPKFVDFFKRAMHLNENADIIIETTSKAISSEHILYYVDKLGYTDNEKVQLQDFVRNNSFTSDYLKTGNLEVIQLFLKLTAREIFFPIFHFTKFKMSLCGNFDLSFPIFFESKEVKEKYSEIAKQAGLFIR